MFLIQQVFVFSRVFVKVWNLSNAFDYVSLKPIPLIAKLPNIAVMIEHKVEEEANDEVSSEESDRRSG